MIGTMLLEHLPTPRVGASSSFSAKFIGFYGLAKLTWSAGLRMCTWEFATN